MARRLRNPQVLLLKHIIRAFCKFSKSYKATGYALSAKKTRYFVMDDEAMGRSCCALPLDVPKGHCAVYVGGERSRYIIPATYLNHSLFRALLVKAEEEFGFDHQMGLTLPCDEVFFEYLMTMFGKKDQPAPANLKLDEIIDFNSQKAMDCTY